jgi:hypothetical protein
MVRGVREESRADRFKRYTRGKDVRNALKVVVIAAVLSVFNVSAEEVQVSKELQAAMKDIAIHSQIVAVNGAGVTVDNFHEDADPATIELVMLTTPSAGASQVSSDGEVIFVQKGASDEEMQSLFSTAFYLKAKAREAAHSPVSASGSTSQDGR